MPPRGMKAKACLLAALAVPMWMLLLTIVPVEVSSPSVAPPQGIDDERESRRTPPTVKGTGSRPQLSPSSPQETSTPLADDQAVEPIATVRPQVPAVAPKKVGLSSTVREWPWRWNHALQWGVNFKGAGTPTPHPLSAMHPYAFPASPFPKNASTFLVEKELIQKFSPETHVPAWYPFPSCGFATRLQALLGKYQTSIEKLWDSIHINVNKKGLVPTEESLGKESTLLAKLLFIHQERMDAKRRGASLLVDGNGKETLAPLPSSFGAQEENEDEDPQLHCVEVDSNPSFTKHIPSKVFHCHYGSSLHYFALHPLHRGDDGVTADQAQRSQAGLCPGLGAAQGSPPTVSMNHEWDEWIRYALGPVFFRLVIESTAAIFNGYTIYDWRSCSYFSFYDLPLEYAGTTMTVKWRALHADYWSVRETDHRTRHSFNKDAILRATKMPGRAQKTPTSSEGEGQRPWWPYWMSRSKEEQLHITDGRGRPLRQRQWMWSGELYDETLAKQRDPVRVRKCLLSLPKQTMMVIGDSQARSVFWGLKDYLTVLTDRLVANRSKARQSVGEKVGKDQLGQDVPDPEKPHHGVLHSHPDDGEKLSYELRDEKGQKIKEASAKKLLQTDLSLYYKWDSYLEKLEEHTSGAAVVIAGFGSHPASWGQWTFRQYAKEMTRISQFLCRLRRQGVEVIWYGAPAWPKPKLVDNFRATNARLGIFNSLARSAFLANCGPADRPHLVDFFELSHGLLRASKDSAHYDGSVVMPVLSQMILSKLCP